MNQINIKNIESIKEGDIVYSNHDLIDNAGNTNIKKHDKFIITEVIIRKGYWSRLCPDIYIHPVIDSIKIKGYPTTVWQPDTFYIK